MDNGLYRYSPNSPKLSPNTSIRLYGGHEKEVTSMTFLVLGYLEENKSDRKKPV